MSNYFFSIFNDFKNNVKGTIDKKLIYLLILFLCFAIGVVLGFAIKPTEFIYEYCLSNAENYYSVVMYKDSSCFSIFIERIFVNFGYFLIVFLLSLFSFLFPLTAIIVVYRGFILALSLTIFFSSFGLTGILIGIFLIIPQNIIVTACLCLVSSASFYIKELCQNNFIKKYLFFVCLLYGISLIGAIIEVLFLCFLLRPMNFYF